MGFLWGGRSDRSGGAGRVSMPRLHTYLLLGSEMKFFEIGNWGLGIRNLESTSPVVQKRDGRVEG